MDTEPLTDAERRLIDHATETCTASFDPEFFDGAHIVAAAVRTTNDEVFDGVSLPASVGRASVCAEPVAVGSAIASGASHDDLETCVAVAYPMPYHDAEEVRVLSPCGTCRELLADYREDLRVVVPVEGENRIARAIDLLPTRTW